MDTIGQEIALHFNALLGALTLLTTVATIRLVLNVFGTVIRATGIAMIAASNNKNAL